MCKVVQRNAVTVIPSDSSFANLWFFGGFNIHKQVFCSIFVDTSFADPLPLCCSFLVLFHTGHGQIWRHNLRGTTKTLFELLRRCGSSSR